MLACKLQTKSAVNEGERDESTANPHVNVAKDSALLMLTEGKMLQKATSSYKPDHSEQKKPDNGVRRVELQIVSAEQL
jgi:hypothetical protein